MLELEAVGTMGKSPELLQAKSGKTYTRFSVACRQKYEENSIWLECTAFEKLAELICKYCDKGSKVWVRGKPKASHYTSKESGEIINKLELTVNDFEICGGKSKSQEGQGGSQEKTTKSSAPSYQDYSNDEIPF